MDIIKSISFSQTEILQNIVDLHTGPIQADVTFGNGAFYRGTYQKSGLPWPQFRFDIEPRGSGIIPADVCHLPIKDSCLRNIVFDPPFMARTGPGAILKARFGELVGTIRDLWNFYFLAMREIHRVLAPGGWLVFKCQNGVLSGKNNNTYRQICNMAETLGLEWVDEFILLATRRMMHPNHKVQRHARKFHCFFVVFRKRPLWKEKSMSDQDIEKRFTYRPPKESQPKKYEILRASAKELAYLITNLCPDSREKALALTKLEETVMWANASIARNE